MLLQILQISVRLVLDDNNSSRKSAVPELANLRKNIYLVISGKSRQNYPIGKSTQCLNPEGKLVRFQIRKSVVCVCVCVSFHKSKDYLAVFWLSGCKLKLED